ncbi:heterokaryon incompatibility protein-domain-containing protein [Echria macrotheca]|uniref:Heterokaryon incompatibility protein-domain-containing protein n=1 Tax=Echria macrotheca TaxID=438768 RepID=A0AAJ0FEF8_9PEZI|nr:heterokaryon incompatibility protein-domain-containing protein [Echria macrotheca]
MAFMKTLYQPLDHQRDCIRLVQLVTTPPPGASLVHCQLRTVSLLEFRSEYAEFVASRDSHTTPSRKTTSLWAAEHADSEKSRSEPGCETTSIPTPSKTAHRFQWGDYAALSYTWGSPDPTHWIVVNGIITPVTESVEVALRSFAQTTSAFNDNSQYGLWIDALCINQSDEAERAAQVAKMRTIYSTAWTVIAWLGEAKATENSDAAFALLRRFAASPETEHDELARKYLETPAPDLSLENAFYGLARLMMRPYWSRLWVVQEIVLGGSATVLRCGGGQQLDWTTFCAGVDVLFRRDMYLLKDRFLANRVKRDGRRDVVWHAYNLHLVHKDLRVLNQHVEEGVVGQQHLGFRRLLDIASHSACRDARDKVFALIGMVHPAIARQVTQSYYSASTPSIFTAVARAYILHSGGLEPLREGNPWGSVGCPTWAADWTWKGRRRYSRVESPVWGAWRARDEDAVDPAGVYKAAGDWPAQFEFIGESLLQCRGFVFDRVVGLGARGVGHFGWDGASIVQGPRSWKPIYGDHTQTARALVETLMLGRGAGAKRLDGRHSAILSLPKTFRAAGPQFKQRGWSWLASQQGYYFRWELWRSTHDGLRLGRSKLADFFTDVIPEGADEDSYNEVYGVFDRSCQERRLMLTEGGRIGWGPDNIIYSDGYQQMWPGDLLCIIFGCSTPLVIRPLGSDGEAFQIVGEAYVHGVMDGEAAKSSGSFEETTFLFS